MTDKVSDDDLREPEGCPVCGAIAGACSSYPNCPGGNMTIKVTVTNSDSRETAVIGVAEWQSSQSGGFDKPPIEPKYLKGGESCEVWVHSGQYLIVKEHKQ
jgi:hypothetical protein